MVIVLMGAAGAGKTTVGRHLSNTLQWRFLDADSLHPPENVAKMAMGLPLTEEDRRPWLQAVRSFLADCVERGADAVVACSLLRRAYRNSVFRDYEEQVKLVYLRAAPALLQERLTTRAGHFAGAALLDTQLATLEEPSDALVLDAGQAPDRLVATIRSAWKV